MWRWRGRNKAIERTALGGVSGESWWCLPETPILAIARTGLFLPTGLGVAMEIAKRPARS